MPVTAYPWHQLAWQEILRRKAELPHALLFRGREGTGKLDFVRRLAQSLACDTPAVDGAACASCLSCRWFAASNHPDYREVLPEAFREQDLESATPHERKPRQEILVDEVRDLQDFINLTALHDRGKIIVFCPAEALNINAANALLKNLEEPPPGTRFMLVTHRASHLPATIVSRCQQVVLPNPSTEVAEQWLREQGMLDPALSLAHTGNAPLAALALNDGEFWAQRKVLLGALAALKVDPLALAEQVREFPVARVLGWLQRWSYDILSTKSFSRVRYNPDFAAALARVAAQLPASNIARYHQAAVRWQRSVHHPLNSRLFIEQLLLSYARLLRGDPLADEYAG